MAIDIFTFGNTPASQYLARTINERSPGASRACSTRIAAFNTNVNQIEQCVTSGTMSAHTAANLLRLLRVEATTVLLDPKIADHKFIGNLLRNVIIGNIKRATRRISTLRKIETGNVDQCTVMRKATKSKEFAGQLLSILGYPVGMVTRSGEYLRVHPEYADITDTTTPELLMQRSDRRCLRQGKPHMEKK